MRILALDTATEACSVAIYTEDGVIGRCRDVGRGHAELILGMVDGILAESGISLGRLDGIAASVGPGAFTGVRISVSVAQGLAFGSGLPVVPVTTLEALALAAIGGGAAAVLACLDARMDEVYWACFSADVGRGLIGHGRPRVSAVAAVSVPLGGIVQGIGRGFGAHAELQAHTGVVLPPGAADALPDARYMATLGAIRLRAGEGVDPSDLTPLYLRDKVALDEAERAAVRAAAPATRP
jgi:tRNA threonylcarbamoyladenosine biosynthesis protein TsaB